MNVDKRVRIAYRAVYCVLGLIGIAASLGLFEWKFNADFYVYYTNLSNYICIGFMAAALAATLRRPPRDRKPHSFAPAFQFMCMIMITVTFFVYNILLAKDKTPAEYFSSVSNLTLHVLLPVMFVLDWALFAPHGKTKWSYPLLSLIMPLLYVAFIVVRGAIVDPAATSVVYPYFFLDVDALGWGGFFLWIAILVAVFVALGYLLLFLDHLGEFRKDSKVPHIFERIRCRAFQLACRAALPFLPIRTPARLGSVGEIVPLLREQGIGRVLLVTDRGVRGLGLTAPLEAALREAEIETAVYDGVVPDPTLRNAEEAAELYRAQDCRAIVAFGGGSAMDCAKAAGARIARPDKPLSEMRGLMKVKKALPLLIAVPTTAGTGSETTLAAVVTDEAGAKYAINDFPLIPRYAVLDASLTAGLPPFATATTGMDALTHAVEAYIGRSTTKKTREYACRAVKLIFANLPAAVRGNNEEARRNMMTASHLAGLAFTRSYVGYVHAVAHALGGKYHIPHGLACAVLLPPVLRMYGGAVFAKLRKLGVAAGLFGRELSAKEGAERFIRAIECMNEEIGIGMTVGAIDEADIPALAAAAAKEGNPLYPVPVLWTAKKLEDVVRAVRS